MTRRSAAVAETRRRIVDATRELHGAQGIAATSFDDIAARAGVGVGTVYRHFRSLDELIPACGAVVMESLAPPEASAAGAAFEGVRDPRARIERLVEEAFGIYERGAPELHAMRRERDIHPAVASGAGEVEASLAALVEAALEPLDTTATDRGVTRALVDLGTWQALRDQGLDAGEAVAAVTGMLSARLLGR